MAFEPGVSPAEVHGAEAAVGAGGPGASVATRLQRECPAAGARRYPSPKMLGAGGRAPTVAIRGTGASLGPTRG